MILRFLAISVFILHTTIDSFYVLPLKPFTTLLSSEHRARDNKPERRPISNTRNIVYRDGVPDEYLNVKRVQK